MNLSSMSPPKISLQPDVDPTPSLPLLVTAGTIMLFVACLALSACSSQQMYSSSQEYRRSECNRIESAQERAACLKQADNSYETYKKETGPDKY